MFPLSPTVIVIDDCYRTGSFRARYAADKQTRFLAAFLLQSPVFRSFLLHLLFVAIIRYVAMHLIF